MKKITIFKCALVVSLLSAATAYANDTANSTSFDFGARVVQRSLDVDGNISNFNDLDRTRKTMLELTASSMFSNYFGLELVLPVGRLDADKTTKDLSLSFPLINETQISYRPGVAIYTKFQLPVNDRLRSSLLLGVARDRYEVQFCQYGLFDGGVCGSNSKSSTVLSAGFGVDYKTTDRLSLSFGYQWRQQKNVDLLGLETPDGSTIDVKVGSSSWSLGLNYQF